MNNWGGGRDLIFLVRADLLFLYKIRNSNMGEILL